MKPPPASLILAITLVLLGLDASAAEAYQWRNVRIGGAGFVSGFVYHPSEPGLAYCRTDMGGAYRRDSADGQWQPLTDWLGYEDMNLMGVEALAIDPSDPDRLYLACGTYTLAQVPDGAFLRSTDRGRTFEVIRLPVKFGANETGRGNGERMSVDPLCGGTILLGTRANGLLRSDDHGTTWRRVTSFPDLAMETGAAPEGRDALDEWMRSNTGSGVFRVIFAPAEGETGHTSTIYAAASIIGRESIFVSRDGGISWAPIPGQPTRLRPLDMDLGPDGVLYVAYAQRPGPWHSTDGEIWRCDTSSGAWEDITPVRSGTIEDPEHTYFGYISVAVDPTTPGVVMAMPFWFPGGEEIFRSSDGGRTWKGVMHETATYDYAKIPYCRSVNIHWLFDVEIDPFDRNHCIFTTGFGCMETFDLAKADAPGGRTLWTPAALGIEESVPLDLLCPSEGVGLVSAIGDYGGFRHEDLGASPADGFFTNPRFGNTTSLAMAARAQGVIVRCGSPSRGETSAIAFSNDQGRSWRGGASPFAGARNGSVALAPDASICVWTPERGDAYRSVDGGATWEQCEGLPKGIRVVADSVDPSLFHAFDILTRTLYTSRDGARSFTAQRVTLPGGLPFRPLLRADTRGGQDRIYASPSKGGELWLAANEGLYVSRDGVCFERLPHVDTIHAFGFGKGAPGAGCESLYIVGIVDGVRGVFRSDDEGLSYVRINDDAHQWGMVLLVAGDMQVHGRVYIGTHGRGIIVGEPAK